MAVQGNMARRALVASLLLVVGCGRADAAAQVEDQTQVQQTLGNVPATVDTTTAASLSKTFRAAAARALPGVVTVQVTEKPQQMAASPFPFPFGQQGPQQQAPAQHGTGSGFVFTKEGYIITNNHVVENATDVQVRFVDGRVYDDVEVVGRDPNTDIAVIKVKGDRDFQPLDIGNSDAAQVGDWVLALGNPLDLGFTVTAGIVSAKGRRLGIIQGEGGENGTNATPPLESFIQTDAAINPGNSGGPLVDLYGRVIGVNSAIYSRTGTYAGNGFAIPSAIAVKAARDIIQYGYVRRPRLGVLISPVGEAQAQLYHLPTISGAVVNEVEPGSPADKAGLKPEDVVTTLNGQPVTDADALTTRLARMNPGDKITLGYIRNGERKSVQIELGQFEVKHAEATPTNTTESAEEKLGIGLTDLTPEIRDQLDLQPGVDGVVVTDVAPFGPAVGVLQRGDVILAFNRKPVSNVRALQSLAKDVDAGSVVVVKIRARSTGNVGVRSFRLH